MTIHTKKWLIGIAGPLWRFFVSIWWSVFHLPNKSNHYNSTGLTFLMSFGILKQRLVESLQVSLFNEISSLWRKVIQLITILYLGTKPKPSLVYFLYIYFVAGILSSDGKERGGLSNALIKLDKVRIRGSAPVIYWLKVRECNKISALLYFIAYNALMYSF